MPPSPQSSNQRSMKAFSSFSCDRAAGTQCGGNTGRIGSRAPRLVGVFQTTAKRPSAVSRSERKHGRTS